MKLTLGSDAEQIIQEPVAPAAFLILRQWFLPR